jgi:Sulfotransferase family
MPTIDDPNPSSPIFLICSERSGSNLVSSMMGEHPEVYAHPPYHLGRDLILRLHEAAAGGIRSRAMRALVRNAANKVTRFRGDEEAARLTQWFAEQADVSPQAIARFVWQQMPLEAHGKRVLVKENNLHQLMFFLVDCFPDAKFVFQVRDPRDYLLSCKLRKKRWLGNKFGSVRNALSVWREDQLGGLTAYGLLGPERVLLQRYEDLVGRSEETLARLCRFLGLEFDPRMLEFHAGTNAQNLAVKGGPRENLAKPVMTGNFRKYRKGLSRGQIRVVEAHVGDLMDRFGYPREFTGLARPTLFSVMKPQFTELFERLVNSEFRPQYKSGNSRLVKELDRNVDPLCEPLWQEDEAGDAVEGSPAE